METQGDLLNPDDKVTEARLDLDKELFSNIPFQLSGMLTPQSKRLLTLPSNERQSDGDFLNLIAEFESMEFFQQFPNDTKETLAKTMTYANFDANEFLLKRHQEPRAMFVILSGVVALRYSASAESEVFWPEQVLRRGDAFGHHDLLSRRSSITDAYTVGYSELLVLKSEDFETVRHILVCENTRLAKHICQAAPLKKFEWSEEEYQVLEMFSKLCSYVDEIEIYNGSEGTKPRYSYFIVSGECKLSRDLQYVSEVELGHKRYKVIDVDVNSPGNQKVLKKSFVFETVNQGFYFGVGEAFLRTRVLSTPAAECVLVPRLLLVFKNQELLCKMREDLLASLPSDQDVLDEFLAHERAAKEVEGLLHDMFKYKPSRLVGGEELKQKPRFLKHV